MSDLVYRKEPPDAPGYWWVLGDGGTEYVVEVIYRDVVATMAAEDMRPGGVLIDDQNGVQVLRYLVAYDSGVEGWTHLAKVQAIGWAGPIGKPRRA